jgi:cholesterol transport system auxiliary component
MKIRSAVLFPALASLAGLSACGGSLFHSNEPPISVYQLSVPAGPAGAEIPADLAVMPVRVRTGLNNADIAVLYPDRRLDHFAGARWSGPLDELVEDLATQAFRGQAHFRNVHTDASMFSAGYWLEIDVADFQAEYPGSDGGAPPTAHVRLVARLGASADRRIIGQFDAEARQPASDNRLTAVVKAYNDAVDSALGKIAAEAADAVSKDLVRRQSGGLQ